MADPPLAGMEGALPGILAHFLPYNINVLGEINPPISTGVVCGKIELRRR